MYAMLLKVLIAGICKQYGAQYWAEGVPLSAGYVYGNAWDFYVPYSKNDVKSINIWSHREIWCVYNRASLHNL